MSVPTDETQETTTGITRRTALARSATGLGIVLTGNLTGLFGTGTATAGGKALSAAGYGPLIPDPAGLLSLPEGFSYKVVARKGEPVAPGGFPAPSDPDGAAAFPRKGGSGSAIVLNHELGSSDPFPVPQEPRLTYDPAVKGGCSIIEVDKAGNPISQSVGVAGTNNNCAGGRTPWQTWLTCEEAESSLTSEGVKRHGYVFEVDPHDRGRNLDPKPIKALGRFAHESVAVDPDTGAIYETEDAGNPNGLFFRWTPPAGYAGGKGALRDLADDAGTLEALRALDSNGAVVSDLSVATAPGTKFKASWANVPDRDARTASVRKQFAATGEITRSRKLEGMWWGDGGCYFVASYARFSDSSAKEHDGQVWFLDPKAQTIELVLFFAYTPGDQNSDPDGPDNITVSPYGGVILAEDGQGTQHLVGSTDAGEVFFFARNDVEGDSEFAGPTFSTDKKTLFVSVQGPGLTYAITGPFRRH